MKALVATGSVDLVRFADVPEPEHGKGQVLVAVSAMSVNRGELHRLVDAVPGWRPGWDFVGQVLDPGSEPQLARGATVFGYAGGAGWAERIAVPAHDLALLPTGLEQRKAVTIPVAGVTALHTLRLVEARPGHRVLVTGASGGVGRFAIQLANRAGAQVTAVGSDRGAKPTLTELGADEVVAGIEQASGSFDAILESAGGASLERAFGLIGPGGTIVTFGNSSRRMATFPTSDFYPKQPHLLGYFYPAEVQVNALRPDLESLGRLAADGDLHVETGFVGDWTRVGEALALLRERRIAGKVVLTVGPTGS